LAIVFCMLVTLSMVSILQSLLVQSFRQIFLLPVVVARSYFGRVCVVYFHLCDDVYLLLNNEKIVVAV